MGKISRKTILIWLLKWIQSWFLFQCIFSVYIYICVAAASCQLPVRFSSSCPVCQLSIYNFPMPLTGVNQLPHANLRRGQTVASPRQSPWPTRFPTCSTVATPLQFPSSTRFTACSECNYTNTLYLLKSWFPTLTKRYSHTEPYVAVVPHT